VVGDVVADGKLTAHDVPVVARVCTHVLELLVRPTGHAEDFDQTLLRFLAG
jgi:hypothetical protein